MVVQTATGGRRSRNDITRMKKGANRVNQLRVCQRKIKKKREERLPQSYSRKPHLHKLLFYDGK